jgi:hypothetical protein
VSKDAYRFSEKAMPESERDTDRMLEELAENAELTNVEKFNNYPVFTSRQTMTRMLTRYELFKMVLDVTGSIFECGVLFGGGLFSFAHYSSIFEPVNAQRRIVGFDTFEGLPSIDQKDLSSAETSKKHQSSMAIDSREMIWQAEKAFDSNRMLNHLPKIDLVKGNVTETMPKYFEDNGHSLVALLYLDMTLYEGTKAALVNCLPRMPKGAVVAFDEFACERWPGETIALLEEVSLNKIELKRFPFDSYVSYFVV